VKRVCGAQRHGHLHGEAFMLMKYVCEACGHAEFLWNSRDGVTPAFIGCSQEGCDGHMQHVDWPNDIYAPHFIPPKGMRVFVDMTPERVREIANRRFDAARGTDWERPESQREAFVRSCLKWLEHGEPDIISWPPGEATAT